MSQVNAIVTDVLFAVLGLVQVGLNLSSQSHWNLLISLSNVAQIIRLDSCPETWSITTVTMEASGVHRLCACVHEEGHG